VFRLGYISSPLLSHCSARTTLVYSPFHDVKAEFVCFKIYIFGWEIGGGGEEQDPELNGGKHLPNFCYVSSWITFRFELCRSHKRCKRLSTKHDQFSLHLLVRIPPFLLATNQASGYSPKKFTSSALNRSWRVPFNFSPSWFTSNFLMALSKES